MQAFNEWAEEQDFWKSSTRDTFEEAYTKLIGLGMNEEEAIELLSELYSAVSEEYGN